MNPCARIRPALEDDAPRLALLATQLGYASDSAQALERLREIRRNGHGEVLVAVDERDVAIAWTHVFIARSLESSAVGEIAGFVVDEGARGRGIGGELLKAAEAWTAFQGLPLLRVRSNTIRVDAHRFYATRGFETQKTQTVFRKSMELTPARLDESVKGSR